MQIVPANISNPIQADFDASGLFIGMLVYDTTSGTPTIVTGLPGAVGNVLPMTALSGSNSYLAFLKLNPERNFMLLIQSYTDGTYTVLDNARQSQSQTIATKVLAPVFIQGLEVMVGCESNPTQQPVVITQNSDGNVLLSFVDEQSQPVDISAATALTMKILEADHTTLLTKSLSSGISLVPGMIGRALVQFSAADMALLPGGDNDAQVSITIDGVVQTFNIYNAIMVDPSVLDA